MKRVPAYSIRRLLHALEVIEDYAERVVPTSLERAKSQLNLIRMIAKFAREDEEEHNDPSHDVRI